MKRIHWIGILLLSTALIFVSAGCATSGGSSEAADKTAEDVGGNPAEITDAAPGAGAAGGADEAKINFEGAFGDFTYTPGTALTSTDTESTMAVASDFVYAGAQSMRINGTLQKDKYSDTIEIGYRIKAAEMLGLKNLELVGKMISMWVYVPAEYTNEEIQMVLMDNGWQGCYSTGVKVVPGQWTKVFFKLLSSGSAENEKYPGQRQSLAAYDAAGAKIGMGAYTSETFNSYAITQIEIRSLHGEPGDNASVFIDSLDWTD